MSDSTPAGPPAAPAPSMHDSESHDQGLHEPESREPETVASPRFFLVLPAAGSGHRMSAAVPKQYLPVHGRPLLWHTLERIGGMSCFSRIVVALAADDPHWAAVETALSPGIRERLLSTTGGAERCASVAAALDALAGDAAPHDWVLVHDAVRPCVGRGDVANLIATLRGHPVGGLLAAPVQETLKEADDALQVARTVDRSRLWRALTPQMFRYAVLRDALGQMRTNAAQPTDEAAAVEALGLPVTLVAGSPDNIKVTWPEDLALVAALLTGNVQEAGE